MVKGEAINITTNLRGLRSITNGGCFFRYKQLILTVFISKPYSFPNSIHFQSVRLNILTLKTGGSLKDLVYVVLK